MLYMSIHVYVADMCHCGMLYSIIKTFISLNEFE